MKAGKTPQTLSWHSESKRSGIAKAVPINSKSHNEYVVMQDGTPTEELPDITLQAEDDISLSDIFSPEELITYTDIDDGEKVDWIIPNVVVVELLSSVGKLFY